MENKPNRHPLAGFCVAINQRHGDLESAVLITAGSLLAAAPRAELRQRAALLLTTLWAAVVCGNEAAAHTPIAHGRGTAEPACRADESGRLDVSALVAAFALRESGGRTQAWGDDGKAWGLYQFHLARWIEYGGLPGEWGKATEKRQHQIMRVAITRYLSDCHGSVDQQVIHAAREHNGWGRASIKYAREILILYKRGKFIRYTVNHSHLQECHRHSSVAVALAAPGAELEVVQQLQCMFPRTCSFLRNRASLVAG